MSHHFSNSKSLRDRLELGSYAVLMESLPMSAPDKVVLLRMIRFYVREEIVAALERRKNQRSTGTLGKVEDITYETLRRTSRGVME